MTGLVRLAVLGCGDVAQIHHLPSLKRFPEVSVAVASDPVPGARAAALRHFPAARAVADWREAISMPDVDAVLICLPNALHAEATEAAADAGLHVYVEKPLARSLTEADRVLAASRTAGVIGMMGFNYRFNKLYSEARRLLETGRLGALVGARSVFTVERTDLPEWKRGRSEGGGALPDLGSHHVDLVRWLLQDEIVEVCAALRSRASEDDTAFVDLRLAGGLLVQSLFAYGSVDEERFEVYGEEGRLVVDRRRHQRAIIEATGEGRLRKIARAARDSAHVRYILEKGSAPGHEPSHGRALRSFAAAVAARTAVQPDLEDGRASVAVLEAAERSARSGCLEQVVRAPAPQPATTRARS